jgi:predicted DNA binding protein
MHHAIDSARLLALASFYQSRDGMYEYQMSVIVEATIPSEAFEVGQILRVEEPTSVTLETMVPLGGRPTPFVRVKDNVRRSFEQGVRRHRSVSGIEVVNTRDGETLYALNWEPSEGTLFRKILDMDVALLGASGDAETWQLELRFWSHEAVSEFQTYYTEHGIPVTVDRIYNPTRPEAGAWYGLTPSQRETLVRAVEAGYYSLPREVSTKELGQEFDISDQAVTERLRRGIATLVTNTLLAAETVERE